MANYADVAVRAVSDFRNGRAISAREAWDNAAAAVFPESVCMQSKGCPRTTFLALCASGAVEGMPASGAVRDSENARHARDCLALLAEHPAYIAIGPRKLWELVTKASEKTYNQQMHVVVGLAQAGLLRNSNALSPAP